MTYAKPRIERQVIVGQLEMHRSGECPDGWVAKGEYCFKELP